MTLATDIVSLIQDIPLRAIFADAHQVRRAFDEDQLAQLADSIREHGIIQPIVVRPMDKTGVAPFEIIAGERRWRASKIAGRETIPAVVRKDLIGQDVSVLQILENLQRADLTLPEIAAGVTKLVAAVGNKKAAQQLGKSEGWISKHIGIEKLPDDVRALVDAGKIDSADMAYELGQLVKLAPEDYWTGRMLEKAGAGELLRADVRDALAQVKEDIESEKQRAAEQKARARADAEAAKTPEFQQRQREQAEQEQQKQAEWDASAAETQKRREAIAAETQKRREAIAALKLACAQRIEEWAPLIERALGVKAVRDEDDGSLIIDDTEVDTNEMALGMAYVSALADEKIPTGPERARYHLEIDLDYLQLQKLLKALAPDAQTLETDRPEKQGDISVGAFITASLDRSDSSVKTMASDIHKAYVGWCRRNKFDAIALNDNRWGDAIAAAGITKVRSNGIRYVGVKLAV